MEIPPKPQRDLPMEEPERANHPLRAMTVPSYATLASLSLALTSLLVLDGCAAIEGIFKAGIGVGALVVITIVAVLGGIAALVFRR
ncbi:MAG: hypothetical protein ABI193_02180 [Minicystis sp.]